MSMNILCQKCQFLTHLSRLLFTFFYPILSHGFLLHGVPKASHGQSSKHCSEYFDYAQYLNFRDNMVSCMNLYLVYLSFTCGLEALWIGLLILQSITFHPHLKNSYFLTSTLFAKCLPKIFKILHTKH